MGIQTCKEAGWEANQDAARFNNTTKHKVIRVNQEAQLGGSYSKIQQLTKYK